MFTCNHGGYPHQHTLAIEARVCWGLVSPSVLKAPSTPPPVRPTVPSVTPPQINFIRDLGGDVEYARSLTRKEASDYIDRLKKGEGVVTTPAAQARSVDPSSDPKLNLLAGLIPNVPDGYFAVQEEEGAQMTFLRISRPKKNKYAGAIKIQTQHGPRLEVEGAIWPSGKFSIYRRSLVDALMLLVVDYQGSALRYARELGKCCRCNASLTDDRSRHYGIGPECETYWPWVIALVDERDSAKA